MNPRQTKSETDFQRALEEIEMLFNAPSDPADWAVLDPVNLSGDAAEAPQPSQHQAVQESPDQSGQ